MVVGQPEFLDKVNAIKDKFKIEEVKAYLKWQVINHSASLLHSKVEKEHFDFFGKKLMGKKVIKVKVGLDLDNDIKRIQRIREEVGNSIKIVVDANQGYTLREAQVFLSKIEAFNISFLEQPVKFSDYNALKRLKEKQQHTYDG
ncbi:MAG: Mandelate racemase/muconate lactonizing protein [Candidatus Parvarchaeum acidiphilum ARMAN-4]|uniref:Mandelate racemase/muconate lactonizing protein n=1 Tax=Candidatus Parvarchaeum acidiphilum ARMAN-4 TaxID=662760 RepID=D2EGB4_PARA4|nr:MAG: Mandelate racemase/muconate lactonizing protein [Candidatus Parvarchaeum acidiphilum ARMAN-4]